VADKQRTLKPRSPLAAVLHPGEHGALDPDGPGVTLRERNDLALVAMIARPGRVADLRAKVKDGLGLDLPEPGRSAQGERLLLLWAGLDRWYAVQEGAFGHALQQRLRAAAGDAAALADQSHGQTVLRLEGPRVRDLLAKGAPVDLDPKVFAVGDVAATTINHTAVQLWRTGLDEYHLIVMRGFARDLWDFLTTMAGEYGYRVAGG